MLGATPAFAALIGLALGLERLLARGSGSRPSSRSPGSGSSRSAPAASLSGARRRPPRGRHGGDLGGYSVAIAPLMRRVLALAVSAVVLSIAWSGSRSWARRRPPARIGLGWHVWALLAFATLGPLVADERCSGSRALHRIGAVARDARSRTCSRSWRRSSRSCCSREQMTLLQVVGGVLIAGGILLARRRPLRTPGDRRVRSRAMSDRDFMPLEGWDHLELWVGNAKQAAYFYEHGVRLHAAPRTRGRRRACATAPRTCSSRATSGSC